MIAVHEGTMSRFALIYRTEGAWINGREPVAEGYADYTDDAIRDAGYERVGEWEPTSIGRAHKAPVRRVRSTR